MFSLTTQKENWFSQLGDYQKGGLFLAQLRFIA